MLTHLQVEEWGSLTLGDGPGCISPSAFSEIQRAWARSTGRDPLAHFWSDGRRAGPRNWIGSVRAGNIQLDVHPKGTLTRPLEEHSQIERSIVQMLAEASGERAWKGETASLSSNGTRLDAVALGFVRRLGLLLQHRRTRVYRTETSEGPNLRGRIRFPRDVTLKVTKPSHFATVSVSRTNDAAENRFLKHVLGWLHRRVSSSLRREIDLIDAAYFVGVSMPSNWRDDWARVRWDKMPMEASAVLHQGRDMLLGVLPGLLSGLTDAQNQIIFTPALFEHFLARRVARAFQHLGVTTRVQKSIGNAGVWLSGPQAGHRAFNLRPDIVCLEPTRQLRFTIDAKWKLLNMGSATLGIDEQDIYQMATYSGRLGSFSAILVFPWLGDPAHPICRTPARFHLNSAHGLDIVVLVVPLAGDGIARLDASLVSAAKLATAAM